MDIDALQATLRAFAAERDWQPFHTPKNLSTALIVEAAELAEIFQWMTPEQSGLAHTDAVVREQIADEVADVLLYLLQIADHTRVDLKRAVGRKLVKNAKKHPPVRSGLPAGSAAGATVETHVLVDWENLQPLEGELRALVPDATDVWIFHGPGQKLDAQRFASFGSRATPVKIARAGKNALDFHLSFYMGYIASRRPDARFVVLSNDRGYGPMLEHAQALGFAARQAGFAAARAPAPAPRGPHFTLAPVGKATARKAAPVAGPPVAKAAGAVKPATAGSAQPKAAAARKAPRKAPAQQAAPRPAARSKAKAAAAAGMPAKKSKGLAQVVASLGKAQSRPGRRSALVAMIQSLLGAAAGDPAVEQVLAGLRAAGQVTIDEQGAVHYSL